LLAPAEQLARFGTQTSRALAADLAAVAGPLLADEGARAVFANAGRSPLAEGAQLVQPELGATLATLRVSGVGDLYQGAMARRLEELSRRVGGPVSLDALRPSVPQILPPIQVALVSDTMSFLPPPADGGLAAAATVQALQAGQAPEAAARRGLSAAAAWRRDGGSPAALLANPPGGDAAWGVLPASASLVVLDREGNAVTCAFSMNNLFGTGRVVPGMGFFLAAAPGVGRVEPPLLSAVLVHNRALAAFRYAGASSGQLAAPLATALPAMRHLVNGTPVPASLATVPEPGRGNAIGCTRYLPGDARQCVAATDPRGAGLAIGGLQ
jgi:gamma-glutamyltranspeptidase/glutathione hydrolase